MRGVQLGSKIKTSTEQHTELVLSQEWELGIEVAVHRWHLEPWLLATSTWCRIAAHQIAEAAGWVRPPVLAGMVTMAAAAPEAVEVVVAVAPPGTTHRLACRCGTVPWTFGLRVRGQTTRWMWLHPRQALAGASIRRRRAAVQLLWIGSID